MNTTVFTNTIGGNSANILKAFQNKTQHGKYYAVGQDDYGNNYAFVLIKGHWNYLAYRI